MYARLPRAFATLPSAPLEIRRVPVEIQDGASNGYYNRAALDGSRPAIYFINLKDIGDWPKYSLPALTYHEGVPGPSPPDQPRPGIEGHSDAAQDRRLLRLFARAGRSTPSSSPTSSAAIKTARAGRLPAVLPVPRRPPGGRHRPPLQGLEPREGDRLYGRHHRLRPAARRSARSSAIAPRSGQACSYKVGHMAWTRAREEAQAALGAGSTSSSSTRY